MINIQSVITDYVNTFFEFSSNIVSLFTEWADAAQSLYPVNNRDGSEGDSGKTEEALKLREQTGNVSILTGTQRNLFEYRVRCYTSPSWLITRCRIILALDDGKAKKQIAGEQRKDIKTIRKWEKRWRAANRKLSELEATEIKHRDYCKRVIAALSDAARPGRPVIFTAEQVVQIIAMACEVRDDSDAYASHWTWGDIARESVTRGIVEKISDSTVGRFLSEARIKPHLSRYWVNAQPEDPEQFEQEIREICGFYHEATVLFSQKKYLVSTDEKTGIQALERSHPTHPAKPGEKKTKPELREHEYERHGTLCLIANFMVATGRIIAPTIGPTRTEEDFAAHIEKTVDTDPEAEWIFVTDRLNTHMSESLVRLVAARCGIGDDLGIKGRKGILASMETRRAFLSDPGHRIRFVYTPKHTSWMNQVEIWFSIITRRLLKRGSFRSTEHLRERILKFISFFNETMAKPFKWTYKGRPLTV